MATFPESEYCTFLYDDGRRCRALKMPTRHVCILHWKQDGQFIEDEEALRDLANCSMAMDTSRGVNRGMRTLWRLYAQGKVPHRKAVFFAWLGQITLCSIPRRGKEKDDAPAFAVPDSVPSALEQQELVAAAVNGDDPLPIPAAVAAVKSGSNGSNGTGNGA